MSTNTRNTRAASHLTRAKEIEKAWMEMGGTL